MLNCIVLMGRLTADPELRATQGGVSICSFTLAVEQSFPRSDGHRATDYVDVVAWRDTAEIISRYFSKGQMMAVQGSLQSRKWQGKDGYKRTSWEVAVQQVHFCGGRQAETDGGTRNVMSRDDTIGQPVTPNSSSEDFARLPLTDDISF